MPSEEQSIPLARKIAIYALFPSVIFGYLYTSLFSLPGVPYFRTGDEEFFWEYAYRMLSGQVFLRDFYQFTPPGVDIFYVTLFRFFGVSIKSTSWAVLLLGIALTLVCFLIADYLMPIGFAMLSAAACLVLLYGDRLDATHHWFSSLAALMAILALFPDRSLVRVAMAGLLIALAAFCTQTAGAVALLACIASLFWEQRIGKVSLRLNFYRMALLLISAMLGWALLSWRFIVEAGWNKYWFAQVVYPQRYVRSSLGFLIPSFGRPINPYSWIILAEHAFIYLIIVLVCPYVIWFCLRRRSLPANQSMQLMLLSSLGVGLMLEVITRLDWNRMDAVAMPGVILCVWAVSRLQTCRRFFLAAGCCVVGCMALTQIMAAQTRHYRKLTLPTGTALFPLDKAAEFEWLMLHTHPGDAFSGVATMSYYMPLELNNPSPVDVLLPFEPTLPEWVTLTISRLEQQKVKYVFWSPRTGILHIADSPVLASDHLAPLRSYLEAHFIRIESFTNGDEIWQRAGSISPAR